MLGLEALGPSSEGAALVRGQGRDAADEAVPAELLNLR
jgi:hypothetical protein